MKTTFRCGSEMLYRLDCWCLKIHAFIESHSLRFETWESVFKWQDANESRRLWISDKSDVWRWKEENYMRNSKLHRSWSIEFSSRTFVWGRCMEYRGHSLHSFDRETSFWDFKCQIYLQMNQNELVFLSRSRIDQSSCKRFDHTITLKWTEFKTEFRPNHETWLHDKVWISWIDAFKHSCLSSFIILAQLV